MEPAHGGRTLRAAELVLAPYDRYLDVEVFLFGEVLEDREALPVHLVRLRLGPHSPVLIASASITAVWCAHPKSERKKERRGGCSASDAKVERGVMQPHSRPRMCRSTSALNGSLRRVGCPASGTKVEMGVAHLIF